MLLNDFFEITETTANPSELIAKIKLNPAHIIFSGHFPGNPITPGVVQITMVKEILEYFYNRELRLLSLNRCKFLKILNPYETPVITIHIDIFREGNSIKINASGHDKETIFFKFTGVYQ